ncbi:MAG: outer membrane beta-barrel protein [Pseudomonadota bacterium]
MRTKSISLLTIILLVMFSCSNSFAQDSKWYIGAGLGGTEIENDIVIQDQQKSNLSRVDERDVGYKILLGYQAIDYFGVELSYNDFGTLMIEGSQSDTGFTSGGKLWQFTSGYGELTAELRSISLGLNFSLPLKKFFKNSILQRISPFFIIGGHYWDLDMSLTGGINQSVQDNNGFDFFYGGGINVDITSYLDMRIEYNFYNLQKVMVEDSDFILASIIFRF